MFAAQALNPPAADDAFSVSTENDLEQHSRRIGGGACFVVTVTRIKTGQVKVVIEQVMDGVGKAARQQLFLQIDHEKLRAQIDYLVPRHESPPNPISIRSLIFHSVHGKMPFMNILFLQRR